MQMRYRQTTVRTPVIVLLFLASACCLAQDATVAFEMAPGEARIRVAGAPFARYVYEDSAILRPYFCDIHAPSGVQITRHHPPREGADATDHADFHPGLWIAFGDINGEDFWRNKARARHAGFVQTPEGGEGTGRFSVRNEYLAADGRVLCTEVCAYEIRVRPWGYLLRIDTEFSAADASAIFGDQEEMGLGVRLATPLTVRDGEGAIVNADGARNEAEVWGKTAAWCVYGGEMEGRVTGVALLPHPANFRPCWFHARDYGLLAANPFGHNAFTGGEKSTVRVAPAQPLRLRFGVAIFSQPSVNLLDIAKKAYEEYIAEP